MWRIPFTIGLLVIAQARGADSPVVNKSVIDYKSWSATTEKPFAVAPERFSACLPGRFTPDLGPHDNPALRLFVNPIAREALRRGAKSMPAGAIVVKEKWAANADRPLAYAAMVKQAAGYDPKHGDWEYVYVDLGEKAEVERGRVQSCIRCHAGAARRDYLFGTHLQFATLPTGNRNARSPTR